MPSRRIYLDYAAATPVDLRVRRAMEPFFAGAFGNPGSLHAFGQEAIAAVDRSRGTIARLLGADFREIIFTASATEANNLALRGAFAAARRGGFPDAGRCPKIIVSAIEHESVMETARALEREGAEMVIAPVDRAGVLDLAAFSRLIDDRTILVSVMQANNEIGTVQPIAEIGRILAAFRADGVVRPLRGNLPRGSHPSRWPLFHTDAAQGILFLDASARNLGVDLMTLSSHKLYGPKGAGVLYIAQRGSVDYPIAPVVFGGGQEFGLRSGTENVPAVVGFAAAVEIAAAARSKEGKRLKGLRAALWRGIGTFAPDARVNGIVPGRDDAGALPGILNIYFPGCDAGELLTRLDLAGVAVSAGSACAARSPEPSPVIRAIAPSEPVRARASIRFSMGRHSTGGEITRCLKILRQCLSRNPQP